MFGKLLKFELKNFIRNNTTVSTVSRTQPIIADACSFTTSELKNGIKILSVKQPTNLSRLAIVLNCGPRFEEGNERGITHVLRHLLFCSNEYNTYISNSRALFQIGSDVSVECTRDNIIIKSTFGSRYLFNVLDFIGSAVSYNKFYYWEVVYALQSCLIDYDNLKSNLIPENVLDELHSKIFRSGYGNSLFVKSDCESKIREYDVSKFCKKHFSGSRFAIAVQSDLSHNFVEEYVEDCFNLQNMGKVPPSDVKTYSGESIIDHDWRYFHSAFGYPAPSEMNPSWSIYKVLQKYLGGYELKPTTSFINSRLCTHMKDLYPNTKTSSFYMPYNNTGLFGFYTISTRDGFSKSLQSVCKTLKTIFNEDVNADWVAKAKNQAKLELAIAHNSSMNYLVENAKNACCYGKLPSLSERMKEIDNVDVKDIKAALKNLYEARPVIVSSGNPVFIPPADDIISWMKN